MYQVKKDGAITTNRTNYPSDVTDEQWQTLQHHTGRRRHVADWKPIATTMSHSRTEETALAAALKTINRVHHRENRPLVDLFPLPPHPHGSCFAAMFPVKSYVFSDILRKSTVISGRSQPSPVPQLAGSERQTPDQSAAEEIEGDSASRETKDCRTAGALPPFWRWRPRGGYDCHWRACGIAGPPVRCSRASELAIRRNPFPGIAYQDQRLKCPAAKMR